jgi:hypothetical protein
MFIVSPAPNYLLRSECLHISIKGKYGLHTWFRLLRVVDAHVKFMSNALVDGLVGHHLIKVLLMDDESR